VLLVIDFINPLDFPEAQKLARSALKAADATARLKLRMTRRGFSTIYANDNYGQWRSEFPDVLMRCLQQAGASASMAERLAPEDSDLILLKPRQSAFFATPLDLLLTQMHAHTLVLAGLATDICIQLTAMDARLRGYRLWVPEDCTAAESPQQKANALSYMARVLDADTRPSRNHRLRA
jgi:nicotinamidase-related amidase